MLLTPNYFLFGQVGRESAPKSVKAEYYHPKKCWRQVQELVQHFWKWWIQEWLPLLSPRQKQNKEQRDLKEGNIVLVISPDTPQGKWSLETVLRVFPEPDGNVRVVKAKVGA